jgi:hypothetical protein
MLLHPVQETWSYNGLAGRNGSGHCGDATMLRDSLAGLIETMIGSAGKELLALLVHHRIDRPQCLGNPRPEGAESTLTENPLQGSIARKFASASLWACMETAPTSWPSRPVGSECSELDGEPDPHCFPAEFDMKVGDSDGRRNCRHCRCGTESQLDDCSFPMGTETTAENRRNCIVSIREKGCTSAGRAGPVHL